MWLLYFYCGKLFLWTGCNVSSHCEENYCFILYFPFLTLTSGWHVMQIRKIAVEYNRFLKQNKNLTCISAEVKWLKPDLYKMAIHSFIELLSQYKGAEINTVSRKYECTSIFSSKEQNKIIFYKKAIKIKKFWCTRMLEAKNVSF